MKTLVATVLLTMSGLGFGQETAAPVAKRPMTFADLMAMKRVSDPQVSPSGKWVMFSVTEVSLEKNTKVNHLWVVPLGAEPMSQNRDMGHPAERQMTFGDGESNGRFSPDGKWVSISEKDQIYLAPWDEAKGSMGEAKALTTIAGGADGAIWSPDSKRLLLVASVYPECSAKATWAEEDACDKAKDEAAEANPSKAQLFTHLLYRHWNAFTGERRSHVLVVNADGGGVRDLTPRSAVGDAEVPTFSLGGPLGYAWAPDSKEVAYGANLDAVPAASTNNDVFTLRLDEAGAKAVKVSTSLGSDDGPQYSPDGKWLAFRSQKRAGYESDRFRLMVFDRQAKTTKELLPNFDRWVDEFVWAPDSASLFFTAGDQGSEPIFSVRADGQDLTRRTFSSLFRPHDNQLGEFGELQISNDGRSLIGTRMTITSPAEVFVSHVGVDSGINVDDFGYAVEGYKPAVSGSLEASGYEMYKSEYLTQMNAEVLSRIDMWNSDRNGEQALEEFHFVGATGNKVEGFIVRPPKYTSSEKSPVKFLIHGGPQGEWGDAWSYRWNAELMAADGYVVVMVNPRGSTGYGQAFIDGVNGDWGGKAYVDLMKGLDAAEAQFPFIDKTRECALGASYGGYMANWVLTHTNRFKCIVTHDGMYNPAAAYGDTEEMWFNEWEFRRQGDAGPGQPWKYAGLPAEQDPFRKWSPMLHIQDAKTPTLVIHSQRDYRLDVSEGFQLFTALQRLGVPSEMLYFPDEGHWVLKPKNSELWYKTVSDWCNKWTKQ